MNRYFCHIVLLMITNSCEGQPNHTSDQNSKALSNCNQQVYGTKKFIKDLPPYICIPEGFIIDDYVRWTDLNGDGSNDFLAVKYNKKQENQVDGDTTYWNFYSRAANDTLFMLRRNLRNIVPPFLKDEALDYVTTHPLADSIFTSYPRRVSHHLSFFLRHDTLSLSYKIDDSYGKTFVFVYNMSKENWYLEEVRYFVGELPQYWWEEDDFYYPLNDQLKVIEKRKPTNRVSIDSFDLKEAFRYRHSEWMHLTEIHIDNLRKGDNRTILEYQFGECKQMKLPLDWAY